MSHPRPAASRPRLLSGIAFAGAAALVAVTATACGGGSGGLGSPEVSTVRVGVVSSVGVVPFEIGTSSAQNAFSAAGLTVDTQVFTSQSAEVAALDQGKIDIAYGEYSEFLSDAGSGGGLAGSGKLRLVSEAYDASPGTIALVARKGGGLPDLNAADESPFCGGPYKIGVSSTYSEEYLALSTWLSSQDAPIELKGCAAVKTFDTPADLITAVAEGTVNAAALQEPYVTTAEVSGGLREIQDLASGNAAGMPLDGYFAGSDFTAKYPNTTAIFASVISQLQTSSSQRVAVETALDTQSGSNPLIVSTMQLGTYPTVVLPATIDVVVQLMTSAGTLAGTTTTATLTDLGGTG